MLMKESSIRLKNGSSPMGFEIRSCDSIIILLMIAEIRVSFFTASLWVPVEEGLWRGYKGLIVIRSCRLRAHWNCTVDWLKIKLFALALSGNYRWKFFSCACRCKVSVEAKFDFRTLWNYIVLAKDSGRQWLFKCCGFCCKQVFLAPCHLELV